MSLAQRPPEAVEVAPSAAQPGTRRGVMIEVTPMAGFAAGALVVSALALAAALGRRYPLDFVAPNNPRHEAAQSLHEAQEQIPLRFDELPVDRGTTADATGQDESSRR